MFAFDPGLNLLINIGVVFFGFIVSILIARGIVFRQSVKNSYHQHAVFLVRLPKDKPKDQGQEFTTQQLREEIAHGETIFSSIGGLKAEGGFHAWLYGRGDHFSFEIVASNNKIAFFVVMPPDKTRYLEQQIHAHYPDASIEQVPDYNIFTPESQIIGSYLKTKKSFVFPLHTYQKMEVDPMNSLINIISKLEKDESIAIQYVVRSAKKEWHNTARKIIGAIQRKNSVKEGLKKGILLYEILDLFKPASKEVSSNPRRLTPQEEDLLKSMEAKNSKAGLDVNIRLVVSTLSKTKSEAYLNNISDSFMEYNHYSYGNSLSRATKSPRQISDFIYRRFDDGVGSLLNTEELASLFHFPLKNAETPNILWLTSKVAPAPSEVPDEGLILGYNTYRGIKKEIRFKDADRLRHTYIIGKSGVGKSVLQTDMIVQDIENGRGVCVFDPHGDLITDVLSRIPLERAEDVIVFSPADMQRPFALNLLEYDPRYPEQKSFVINEMIGIFDKLYDLKATGGPMFEQYMRNALLLIMDDPETGSTLLEIPKVLADENFRKMKLSKCKNSTVVDFWRKEADKAGGDAALANIVPYITSKLTSFVSNDMMRTIIGQQNSSFNFRNAMDTQKIILVDIPKGVIGEMNTYLLGMIIVGKILMAALSRTDMPQKERKDFYLYIDEFQNFTTNSICQILSEARKYGLGLIIAHQYIGQLSKNNNTEIKDAVFGNVGTMIAFKVGAEDAEFLIKEFGPVFNEFDLVNVPKGTAYLKLLVDNAALRPFSLQPIWPIYGTERPEICDKIRTLSRLKYGQDRSIVEAEIARRALIV
ncbi:MAG: type IV secretory system conjugative DNA transfer family protein [Patescibacteria group bacterium]